MGVVLVLLTLGLAFANGANDVSKGIATLVGSGTTRYRTAVAWGTAWTLAGGLVAAFFSQGLVATFSGKGLLVNPPEAATLFSFRSPAARSGGFSSRPARGFPSRRRMRLPGALCGAGLAASGAPGVAWAAVAKKVALPLALSPVISAAIVLLLAPAVLPVFRRAHRFCVCVERREPVPAAAGVAFASPLPTLDLVASSDCPPETLVRVGAPRLAALDFGGCDELLPRAQRHAEDPRSRHRGDGRFRHLARSGSTRSSPWR